MFHWFQETGLFIVRHCPYFLILILFKTIRFLVYIETNTIHWLPRYPISVVFFMDNAALRHHRNTQIIPVTCQTRASKNTVGELFSRLKTRLDFHFMSLDTRSGVTYITASRLNCPCTQQIKETTVCIYNSWLVIVNTIAFFFSQKHERLTHSSLSFAFGNTTSTSMYEKDSEIFNS